MTLRFSNVRVCAGGNHVIYTVTIDGTPHVFTCDRSDVLQAWSAEDRRFAKEAVLPFLMRVLARQAGATTLPQAKAAIEAAEIEI